jgi:hypothetical protein
MDSSICELKSNAYGRGLIDRLTRAQGGTELDVVGAGDGCLVEAVSQASENALDAGFAHSGEQDLEQDFAFDTQLAGFLGVGRARLGEDFDGCGWEGYRSGFVRGGRGGDFAKSGGTRGADGGG